MKRKYISNMPIEGFSKYHICKNGRLYSIHSGTWRLIKPVEENIMLNYENHEEDFKRSHGMES